jgi:hypothetical protein
MATFSMSYGLPMVAEFWVTTQKELTLWEASSMAKLATLQNFQKRVRVWRSHIDQIKEEAWTSYAKFYSLFF